MGGVGPGGGGVRMGMEGNYTHDNLGGGGGWAEGWGGD